jgi:hypothetical protein
MVMTCWLKKCVAVVLLGLVSVAAPSSASTVVSSGFELLTALRGGSTEIQLASHVRLGGEWASADVVELRKNVTLRAQTSGTRLDLNYEAWRLRVEPGAWLHVEGLELMRARRLLPGLGAAGPGV